MAIKPHYDRFPSLNALRAFEAAARLGGFAQAAQEMSVTAGAVAAQVKLLEDEYGAKLFERQARGVRLTLLGRSVQEDFTGAFDALGEAARKLRRLALPTSVHIVTSPALAQLWLAPRVIQLRQKFATIDLSVTALEEPPHLKRGPFDISLFYTEQAESHHRHIIDEHITPVCAPSVAGKLTQPADLADVTCIGDVVWEDWKVWVQGMRLDEKFKLGAGPSFSLYAVAVQEALLGLGVIMGRRSLVQPYLESGALVAPFDSVPLGLSINAWTLPESRKSAEVNAVMDAMWNLR
ncbi:LysR substrate-binding domain-containing protein [Ensifer sp. SSB1]|jgi:LysR family glycine cleavage system transcriptional activator|uniref:LysR substrate-binding domain-containing protein n=1 Tax=Ensifer sp. SSB1 TaxID=2795385 RepID=UPI001A3A80B5|nr:LysR substrate-binding domain-containing protein [Ensifer sp. SSB1]MBK5567064.1 LysR family transcriptional regulator [Ensifer sp. SSB1]